MCIEGTMEQSSKHGMPRVCSCYGSSLKTVIVALQVVSALYTFIGVLAGTATFDPWVGVNAVCFPLAIVGFLRLFAATRLLEDFIYACSIDPFH